LTAACAIRHWIQRYCP